VTICVSLLDLVITLANLICASPLLKTHISELVSFHNSPLWEPSSDNHLWMSFSTSILTYLCFSWFQFDSNSILNKSPAIQELYLIVWGTQLFKATIVHLRCKYQNTNTRTLSSRLVQCKKYSMYFLKDILNLWDLMLIAQGCWSLHSLLPRYWCHIRKFWCYSLVFPYNHMNQIWQQCLHLNGIS